MLNNFKALTTENSIMDLISSYTYPQDPQNEHEPGSLYVQPSLDLYNTVADDLQSGLLLAQLNQERNKAPGSPKKDYHLAKKVQNLPKPSLLGFRTDQEAFDPSQLDDVEAEGSDSDSETDSAKKRGKYRTYTDDEKNHIIKFMMKHGIQQTLEIFSGDEHKITKRKLKSWLESQNKVKGVKGRKSNDPARDRALHGWCMDFQNEHGRPPSRKEATQKALELSGDPNFQASKGWLDKFSRKYNLEFTPLKIIPPRGKKKVKTAGDNEPVSAASTQASGLIEGFSPVKEIRGKLIEPEPKKIVGENAKETKPEGLIKVNPLFTFNSKPVYQQPHPHPHPHPHPQHPHPHPAPGPQTHIQPPQSQVQAQQSQQQQPQQANPAYPTNNHEGNYTSLDPNIYQAFSNLEGPQGQGFPYPFNYPLEYSMPYSLNYQKMYPRKSYPMNYPMNLPMNYPSGFAENLQLLQQMLKKENEINHEKPQFS